MTRPQRMSVLGARRSLNSNPRSKLLRTAREKGSRWRDGHSDATPEAAATFPHWFPASPWSPLLTCGQRWEAREARAGPASCWEVAIPPGHRPDLLSLEAALLLDSVGKDDVSMEGSPQEQGDSGLSPESN